MNCPHDVLILLALVGAVRIAFDVVEAYRLTQVAA